VANVGAVYRELIAQGASTVQALGIMANMINESGFNPEAIGDGGTSFGLVQQHGDYGHLVTGDPAADMKAQIATLKSLGGFRAASGSTPAQAAGNFAANYERCVGCQPGGDQWNGRVANAGKVLGWYTSGKWPSSGGSPSPGAAPGGGGKPATLTAWGPGNVLPDWTNPLTAIKDIGGLLTSPVTGAAGVATGLEGTWRALTAIGSDLNVFMKDIEWLFVPSHWVRVACFVGGTLLLVPGLVKLAHAGDGGMSLAIGILLITLSAALYFLAFHNLPDDVKDLQGLLHYVSEGIRGTAPKVAAQ